LSNPAACAAFARTLASRRNRRCEAWFADYPVIAEIDGFWLWRRWQLTRSGGAPVPPESL